MKKIIISIAGVFLLLQLPLLSTAQDVTSSLKGMQPVLDNSAAS